MGFLILIVLFIILAYGYKCLHDWSLRLLTTYSDDEKN